ncbi:22909_t:CDS:2, partial [Racocetra persica]
KNILVEAQERQKIYADKRRCFCELKEKEGVSMTNLTSPENLKRRSKKLIPKYIVFHVSCLKPYYHNEIKRKATPPLLLLLIDLNVNAEYEGYLLHNAIWEPFKNLENCRWLVDNFKKKSGSSLSSEEYREIDYLQYSSCNDYDNYDKYDSCNDCNDQNEYDDYDEYDLCNDRNDHNDHNKYDDREL